MSHMNAETWKTLAFKNSLRQSIIFHQATDQNRNLVEHMVKIILVICWWTWKQITQVSENVTQAITW